MNETSKTCTHPESHVAHMMLNGECPWCGAYDPSQIDESMSIEDFG